MDKGDGVHCCTWRVRIIKYGVGVLYSHARVRVYTYKIRVHIRGISQGIGMRAAIRNVPVGTERQ